jgi:uncharacterized protein YdhG (YjbR/CyaY superfamily)
MPVIDDYFANVPVPERAELERIRQVVRSLVPDAEEVISYGMPVMKYKGKYLVGFNAFKDHLSLFPTSEPIEKLKDRLKDYKLARGTIQFTLHKPLPEEVIREIVLTKMIGIDSSSS